MTERALIGAALLTVAVGGCGESALLDAVNPALLTASPTYTDDVALLLREHCVPCHSSDGLRRGGVELDRYQSAHSGRVRNTCVAVREELVAAFAAALMPYPRDPPVERVPCKDWAVFSMPPGSASPLSTSEQVVLLRWVETGGPE